MLEVVEAKFNQGTQPKIFQSPTKLMITVIRIPSDSIKYQWYHQLRI
jgi:hypothetical protein